MICRGVEELRKVVVFECFVIFGMLIANNTMQMTHACQGTQETAKMSHSQDMAIAAYQLGRRYEMGDGVPVCMETAARFYRQAAMRGHADAQHALGFLHATGQGIARDERLAVQWLTQAAEQGHPDAQHNLGVMYTEGRGVEVDYGAAVKWFYKAALNGSMYAREWLESRSEEQHSAG